MIRPESRRGVGNNVREIEIGLCLFVRLQCPRSLSRKLLGRVFSAYQRCRDIGSVKGAVRIEHVCSIFIALPPPNKVLLAQPIRAGRNTARQPSTASRDGQQHAHESQHPETADHITRYYWHLASHTLRSARVTAQAAAHVFNGVVGNYDFPPTHILPLDGTRHWSSLPTLPLCHSRKKTRRLGRGRHPRNHTGTHTKRTQPPNMALPMGSQTTYPTGVEFAARESALKPNDDK